MAHLFTPYRIRGTEFGNRICMSPMCMYSAAPAGEDMGRPTDFHVGHYATRAAGGLGLVMVEATSVRSDGGITPWDLGLWNDHQASGFARIAEQVHAMGALAGAQIAHAGRKASARRPWEGGGLLPEDEGGWQPVAPSAIGFPDLTEPRELSVDEIADLVQCWADAARRAVQAGFDVVEIHGAHGYLIHEFLSPLSNWRSDEYGGTFEGRARFPLEVIDAVRAAIGDDVPLFMRISMTDWVTENDGSEAWTVEDAIAFARLARDHGVDLIDASSGGLVLVPIPHDVDYQTRNAARLRSETGMPVGAIGRITDADQAERLIAGGEADLVFIGRRLLGEPSWANHAALHLGAEPRYIDQYGYAIRRRP